MADAGWQIADHILERSYLSIAVRQNLLKVFPVAPIYRSIIMTLLKKFVGIKSQCPAESKISASVCAEFILAFHYCFYPK